MPAITALYFSIFIALLRLNFKSQHHLLKRLIVIIIMSHHLCHRHFVQQHMALKQLSPNEQTRALPHLDSRSSQGIEYGQ